MNLLNSTSLSSSWFIFLLMSWTHLLSHFLISCHSSVYFSWLLTPPFHWNVLFEIVSNHCLSHWISFSLSLKLKYETTAVGSLWSILFTCVCNSALSWFLSSPSYFSLVSFGCSSSLPYLYSWIFMAVQAPTLPVPLGQLCLSDFWISQDFGYHLRTYKSLHIPATNPLFCPISLLDVYQILQAQHAPNWIWLLLPEPPSLLEFIPHWKPPQFTHLCKPEMLVSHFDFFLLLAWHCSSSPTPLCTLKYWNYISFFHHIS